MQKIRIYTLVDITNTGITRYVPGKEIEYAQNKNWNTFTQCLGLRSIILYDEPPTRDLMVPSSVGLGNVHKGLHNVWSFTFYPDQDDVYHDGIDPLGLLIGDVADVPVLTNLHETINISKRVFDISSSATRNICIKLL